jgi:GNAT superfamily N-acetyltransferase
MIIRSPKNEKEMKEYLALRYRVLREPWGQPPGSENDPTDKDATHAAMFDGDTIVAIARLEAKDEQVGQIRYMAVHPDHQNKNLGGKVLEYLEDKAREMGLKKVILNAREKALNFYKRNDYSIVEKSYLLFDSIQHYLMEKTL